MQSIEPAALACCAPSSDDASELEYDGAPAIHAARSCSGCADVPLGRILNHLDARPVAVPAPEALSPALVLPRLVTSRIGRRIAWRTPDARRDLPGAGSTPQIRRN